MSGSDPRNISGDPSYVESMEDFKQYNTARKAATEAAINVLSLSVDGIWESLKGACLTWRRHPGNGTFVVLGIGTAVVIVPVVALGLVTGMFAYAPVAENTSWYRKTSLEVGRFVSTAGQAVVKGAVAPHFYRETNSLAPGVAPGSSPERELPPGVVTTNVSHTTSSTASDGDFRCDGLTKQQCAAISGK